MTRPLARVRATCSRLRAEVTLCLKNLSAVRNTQRISTSFHRKNIVVGKTDVLEYFYTDVLNCFYTRVLA